MRQRASFPHRFRRPSRYTKAKFTFLNKLSYNGPVSKNINKTNVKGFDANSACYYAGTFEYSPLKR